MIEITALAAEKMSAYLIDNKIDAPVRIAVMSGCGGPSLGLAVDKRKENDYSHEDAAITLVIDKELSQTCGRVRVDYKEQDSDCGCSGGGGFAIVSEKPLPASSGGCGSTCSSGSCGC